MKKCMEKLESLLELGGTKKDIALLVISGIALLCSLFDVPLPFSPAWIAIILCGVPIVLEKRGAVSDWSPGSISKLTCWSPSR